MSHAPAEARHTVPVVAKLSGTGVRAGAGFRHSQRPRPRGTLFRGWRQRRAADRARPGARSATSHPLSAATFGARQHESVRRACRARAGARLGDVADAECRTAFGAPVTNTSMGHVPLEPVQSPRRRTDHRGATLGAAVTKGVGRAGVGDTVAQLRHVARPDRRTAHAPALHSGGTGGRPGADLRRIGSRRRKTADGAPPRTYRRGSCCRRRRSSPRRRTRRRRATDRRALHVRGHAGPCPCSSPRCRTRPPPRGTRCSKPRTHPRGRCRRRRRSSRPRRTGPRRAADRRALQVGRARGGGTRAVLRVSHAPAEARQTVLAGAEGVGGQVSAKPSQLSATSHAGRRTADRRALRVAGQKALPPSHVSATSHAPAAGRHTVPAA